MSTAIDYLAIAYLAVFAWGCTWNIMSPVLWRLLFAQSPADKAMELREAARAQCRIYGHLPPVTGSTCQRCGATIKDRL